MKILRVAIFPSIEKRTVGLHPAKLCKINSVKTIYLTSKDNVTRPKVEGDYKLFEFAKPLENRVAEQKRQPVLSKKKKTQRLKKFI